MHKPTPLFHVEIVTDTSLQLLYSFTPLLYKHTNKITVAGFNLEMGWEDLCCRFAARTMATANWAQEDQRRMLHAVYRVGDLQKTVDSYKEQFGMQLLREIDKPDEKFSVAFMGYGSEEDHFTVELTYNYGVDNYDLGEGFGHFAIYTPDAYKTCEDIKKAGGNVCRACARLPCSCLLCAGCS